MLLIAAFSLVVLALVKPVGLYLTYVFEGRANWLAWPERLLYRFLGVRPDEDQDWKRYAGSLLAFSFLAMAFTYGLLRLQGLLPLNPQGHDGEQMPPHLAFNVAASFMTNTNWQSYSPEATLSYFSNMAALAMHNWASAAVGLAVAAALVRGLVRKSAGGIGNFWADVVRGTLYVLLPISVVGALAFVAMGVPQTLDPPRTLTTLAGGEQTVALGPVASQVVIKHLGTNGGGFYNANSAHPFENPSTWSNLLSMLLILLIPAGLTYMFGKMTGNVRQGWAVFGAMSLLFLAGAIAGTWAEGSGNPHFARLGVEATNLEGKEMRFGIEGSTLFTSVTTAASCGAVNSALNSYTPLGGLVPLFNILTGEVVFGGIGLGLCGMLLYGILAVFIAGLMVGRTPEYLGKKIGKFEVQMALLALLAMAFSTLGMTAIGSTLDLPKTGPLAEWNAVDSVPYGPMSENLGNPAPRGFTELLYAFASASGNNGSAFAALSANTPIYNTLLGLAMLVGRFLVIIPVLAIAGHMARKPSVPSSAGTFPTDSLTFSLLLVGVVLVLGALTFFPALALGPVVEHLQMTGGR